ncbi:hypothetical protein OE749_14970 [Aestuariibacter sp. AA17]|uniref:Uncharacterized protein n=1 Tax=Fluctibacter corallii TaxID=2984329 RepID=A0ABT3ABF2_9ALTE|nr:hypothetical protein [Aestuariibacter sp. AA17]MCV2885993.1 hypothetical protein [Aestuariibacter sp. AA17]
MTDNSNWHGEERRQTPRKGDRLYRIVEILNICCWLVFLAALIVFHYARPELISGVQEYWGINGRDSWAQSLTLPLLMLLVFCLMLTSVVFVLRRKRNRRKRDFFGINLYFLLALVIIALLWITAQVSGSS